MSIEQSSLRNCVLAAVFLSCAGTAAALQQAAPGIDRLKPAPALADTPSATFNDADVERDVQRVEMDRIGTLPVSCHGRRQHGVLYNVRRLPVGDAAAAEAHALNDAGLAVGYRGLGVDIPVEPSLWAGARRYVLSTPPGAGGIAYGVGDTGAIVGWVGVPGEISATVGALWYGGARYTLRNLDFNSPDNLPLQASAVAINRQGTILGNANTVATDNNRPIVWRRGVPRLLPALVSLAIGRAINDAGFVVGSGDYPQGVLRHHALLWTPDGRVVDLDPKGVLDSRAYDINNKGKIVGWAEPFGGEVGTPALWYHGRRTALPLPGGIAGSAVGINERDQIVGNQVLGPTRAPRAVTWYGSVAYQLDTLLDDESRGIVIDAAQDINDRGQILATTTLSNGQPQPLLLTPRPCYRR